LFENEKINRVLIVMRKTHEGSSRGWCTIDCLRENTEFKDVEYINGCDTNIEKVMRAITRMNEASVLVCLLGEVGPIILMDYMEKVTRNSAAWRQQSREFFAGCEDIYVLNADQNLMSNQKLYSEIIGCVKDIAKSSENLPKHLHKLNEIVKEYQVSVVLEELEHLDIQEPAGQFFYLDLHSDLLAQEGPVTKILSDDLFPFIPNSKLCVQIESVFLVCPFVGGSI
jgi:hypothetical protein